MVVVSHLSLLIPMVKMLRGNCLILSDTHYEGSHLHTHPPPTPSPHTHSLPTHTPSPHTTQLELCITTRYKYVRMCVCMYVYFAYRQQMYVFMWVTGLCHISGGNSCVGLDWCGVLSTVYIMCFYLPPPSPEIL